jgi:hypothetical protein
MSIPPISGAQRFVDQDGRPTPELLRLLNEMRKLIEANDAFREAVGDVTKPTGGATTDAEARTAIDSIIDAA